MPLVVGDGIGKRGGDMNVSMREEKKENESMAFQSRILTPKGLNVEHEVVTQTATDTSFWQHVKTE